LEEVRNTETWNDAPQACTNGVWRRLYPDIVKKFAGFGKHFANATRETRHITDEAGIMGVDADDVE
jgi:hypothetical protein